MGRPRWNPPRPEDVEKLAATGMSTHQIADALGISFQTLMNKRRQLAEFNAAISRGQARGIAVVTNKLYALASNGHFPSIALYLRHRAGWHERDPAESRPEMRIDLCAVLRELGPIGEDAPEEIAEIRRKLNGATNVIETTAQPVPGKPESSESED